MIPELVGRLPVTGAARGARRGRARADPGRAEERPHRAVPSSSSSLRTWGSEFEPEALRAVARKALKRSTGARGLRAILETVMTDIMFELPSRDDVD